jgi:hypothetical protein
VNVKHDIDTSTTRKREEERGEDAGEEKVETPNMFLTVIDDN